MSDARHALMAEIYRVLLADGTLAAQLAGQGVFDGVPQGAAHPFVSIGEVRSGALDADAVPTMEHRVELIVNTRSGRREASEIADRVRAVLEDAAMAPEGHRLVSLGHRDTDVTSSRDGRAFRARMRFRALTEAN
ncbi:DUF3168 domain-containing protein [Acuticoccus sp. I52.16.1]|uniref:DUF3168 domain-containing protein n=1 Tax=Acuticoccus sp. I52.16.1 TaxID=2928472 RepID=UPI001FCF9166|nr:DUF3168 domain-containing protein [Acuticoccus sp. I52.16.1]UOM33830.1 DUF3168 domain-containing protein [Acuticoccus sp. I52.16.1]